MSTFKNFALAAAGVSAALAFAAPANAVVTTFASFNAASAGNVVWVNNGTGGNTTTYRNNGTGGTIFTTNSAQNLRPASAVPGGVAVTFSFLNGLNGLISNLPAIFTLSATAVNSPVQTAFGFKFQNNIAGSFSFLSDAPVIVEGTTYVAGSNLLSGSFNLGTIAGQTNGTSGALSSSFDGSGANIVYTSDFVSFANTTNRDLSLSLTSIVSLVNNINRGLNNTSTTGVGPNALRSFRATATGSFSSDPAPAVTVFAAVPEPQSWAMFVIGFGLIGVAYRRRKSAVAAA
jgi:hypothetical protein